jgi:hypothetical protein
VKSFWEFFYEITNTPSKEIIKEIEEKLEECESNRLEIEATENHLKHK